MKKNLYYCNECDQVLPQGTVLFLSGDLTSVKHTFKKLDESDDKGIRVESHTSCFKDVWKGDGDKDDFTFCNMACFMQFVKKKCMKFELKGRGEDNGD